ncbi:MAG: hypothetical protein Q8Q14_01440 [Gemmatimonadales bacterium]|nr:hypothetical protein [Gemmatimonadales bacterium]
MKLVIPLLLALIVLATAAATRPAAPTAWEYHFLPDQRGKWAETTKPLIDSLGRAGWELVTYVPPGQTDFGGYFGQSIFKRPLDAPQ